MAVLTITAGSVVHTSGEVGHANAAASITAGQAIYLNASNLAALAQADGTAAEAAVVGIALNAAGTGQPVTYAKHGSVINIGATTEKVHYFANATAGGVGLQGDIGSSDFITRIGYSLTTDGVFYVDIKVTGAEF